MSDPLELLRQLDPEPAAKAPPIERFWTLTADGALLLIGHESLATRGPEHGRRQRQARGSAFGLRVLAPGLLAVIAVALAVAIGVGAVLTIHAARHPVAARPNVGHGLPSARGGLVGVLGVLRRPQTQADRNAAQSLPLFVEHVRAGRPVASLMRLATVTPWGQKVVLIPMRARTGTWPTGSPHGLRLATGGGCCISASDVLQGQAWTSGGNGSVNYVVLVVPDGVARVSVAFRHPITAIVHNNVAAFQTPSAVENLGAYTMTWYSHTGAILRRFPSFLPTPAAQRAERPQRIRQAERSTTTMAPTIRQHFALFAPSAVGTFRDGPETVTISQPPIPSWPTFLLQQWVGPEYDLHHIREITTRGTTIWILATNHGLICVAGPPGEGVGACSTDARSTLKLGMVAEPSLHGGGRLTIAIVPSTNHTITVKTINGQTRVIPVNHGVFATSEITEYQVVGVNGKTTWIQP